MAERRALERGRARARRGRARTRAWRKIDVRRPPCSASSGGCPGARAGRERCTVRSSRAKDSSKPKHDDLERVGVLGVDRPGAGHEGVVALDRADLGDQQHQLRLQLVEDGPRPRRSSSRARSRRGARRTARRSRRSSRCSGASARPRARDGRKRRSRSPRAARPDVVRLGGCAGHLGDQPGNASSLVVVAARGVRIRDASSSRNRAAARRVRPMGSVPISSATNVSCAIRSSVVNCCPRTGPPLGRHHHGLVPEEQLQGAAAKIVDLGRRCLQLVKAPVDCLSSARGRLTLAVSRKSSTRLPVSAGGDFPFELVTESTPVRRRPSRSSSLAPSLGRSPRRCSPATTRAGSTTRRSWIVGAILVAKPRPPAAAGAIRWTVLGSEQLARPRSSARSPCC